MRSARSNRRTGRLDLASLVPLAAGGAILTGPYSREVVINTSTGETQLEFRGSWIVRVAAAGRSIPPSGSTVEGFPMRRPIELVRELADVTLQGYDRSVGSPEPLRLAANGDAAPGFGPRGVTPITKSPITMPLAIESDGEWFALVWGPVNMSSMRSTVGLVRCGPDGVIDPNFGAGAATPSAGRFVDVNSVHHHENVAGPELERSGWSVSNPSTRRWDPADHLEPQLAGTKLASMGHGADGLDGRGLAARGHGVGGQPGQDNPQSSFPLAPWRALHVVAGLAQPVRRAPARRLDSSSALRATTRTRRGPTSRLRPPPAERVLLPSRPAGVRHGPRLWVSRDSRSTATRRRLPEVCRQ